MSTGSEHRVNSQQYDGEVKLTSFYKCTKTSLTLFHAGSDHLSTITGQICSFLYIVACFVEKLATSCIKTNTLINTRHPSCTCTCMLF